MTKAWVAFCVCVWIYLIVSTWRDKRKRKQAALLAKDYAMCPNCRQVLSEWFLRDGYMWHPEFVRGCGFVSEFSSHEEYRAAQEGE